MLRIPLFQSPGRLPLMTEAHPESKNAAGVEIGLQTVLVDAIKGTVSANQSQRDADFMPLREARGPDWTSRWQRLQEAARTQAILPPVDVVQVGTDFWVVDGHNRVALARATGQLAIDANVTVLHVAGSAATRPLPLQLTTLMEDGQSIRAALMAHQPWCA